MSYRPILLCVNSILYLLKLGLILQRFHFLLRFLKQCFCFGNRRYISEAKPSYSAKRDTPTIRTPLHTNNMNLYYCGVGWSGRVLREAGRVSRMSGWQLQNTEMRYNTTAKPNQSDPRAESRHVLHIHSMTRQNRWNLIHIRAYGAELC